MSFFSCNNTTSKERKYTSMYIQSGHFDSLDIDVLLNKQMLISEDSIKRITCCANKIYKETISLDKNNKQVVVSIKKDVDKQAIIYSTDSIDFLIFYSEDNEHYDKIFILHDIKFKEILYELIENDKFILKQLNEEPPSAIEQMVE